MRNYIIRVLGVLALLGAVAVFGWLYMRGT